MPRKQVTKPDQHRSPERLGQRLSGWTSYPSRYWEKTENGLWASTKLTRSQIDARKAVVRKLKAVAFNIGEVSDQGLHSKMTKLVETLNPEEKERLRGWLKPIEIDEKVEIDREPLTNKDLGIEEDE